MSEAWSVNWVILESRQQWRHLWAHKNLSDIQFSPRRQNALQPSTNTTQMCCVTRSYVGRLYSYVDLRVLKSPSRDAAALLCVDGAALCSARSEGPKRRVGQERYCSSLRVEIWWYSGRMWEVLGPPRLRWSAGIGSPDLSHIYYH
jgi:hypothetical protein